MKKLLIILIAVSTLFISCNPDSSTSIIFDKMHANPSSDYRIYNYVGDYTDSEGHMNLVLGTNLGIMLYDITDMNYSIIVEPIARPLMLVANGSDTYVIYYQQNRGETETLKAVNINTRAIIDAVTLSINDKRIEQQPITNVYMATTQNGGTTTGISYTVQIEQEEDNTNMYDREIIFYQFKEGDITFTPDSGTLSVSNAVTSTATSSTEVAPYIVGDGYVAYIDENESYNKVFAIDGAPISVADETDYICPDNEVIAYFGKTSGSSTIYDVLVDNSGNVYVRDSSSTNWNGADKGDYGSFPLDNRRVAYSTIIDDELFIGFKYGPEIVTVNMTTGKIQQRDTSDINDETIVGIKHHDGYYYVVTEESEVIKTGF